MTMVSCGLVMRAVSLGVCCATLINTAVVTKHSLTQYLVLLGVTNGVIITFFATFPISSPKRANKPVCTKTLKQMKTHLRLFSFLVGLVFTEAAVDEDAHLIPAVGSVLTQLLQVLQSHIVTLAKRESLAARTRGQQKSPGRWMAMIYLVHAIYRISRCDCNAHGRLSRSDGYNR